MEKRKLAQIPREEATDEMVRFAERAAGTHGELLRHTQLKGDVLWRIYIICAERTGQ